MEEVSKSCLTRFDHYYWPYTTKDYIGDSIFIQKGLFFIYRVLSFTYCIAVLVIYFETKFSVKRLLDLGSFNQILTSLYFLMCLVNYGRNSCWKFTHFLFELIWCLNMNTVVLFWAAIFPTESWDYPLYLTILIHAGTPAVLVFEALNNNIAFLRRHLQLVCLCTLGYLVLNAVYSLSAEPVYNLWNYKDVYTYLYILAMFGIIFFAFYLGHLLLRFKLKFKREDLIPGSLISSFGQTDI